MSASQVIIRTGPDYSNTEGLHYKPVDLTPQKMPQLLIKSDTIKAPQSEKVDLKSAKPDVEEDERRLQRSDFEFLTTLGTGTFARVWLVKPTKDVRGRVSTSQVYALKILRKADVIRLKQCEHTRNERHILWCSRKHPFIAHLVDSWTDWNSLYLLMNYAPGGELFSYLRRNVRFSISVTRFYTAEITSAFVFLHRNGVIYRDLKPENVMIDARGHVCLVDFGFSKEVGECKLLISVQRMKKKWLTKSPVVETYTLCGMTQSITCIR